MGFNIESIYEACEPSPLQMYKGDVIYVDIVYLKEHFGHDYCSIGEIIGMLPPYQSKYFKVVKIIREERMWWQFWKKKITGYHLIVL